jgi:hypothetical protein
MDMKWHPIKDWYEEKLHPEGVYLFTFRDDPNDIEHLGVDMGKFELGVPTVVTLCSDGSIVHLEDIIAWAGLPEPFYPKDCTDCAYWSEWTDESGDRLSDCKLLKTAAPFKEIRPEECPINRMYRVGALK